MITVPPKRAPRTRRLNQSAVAIAARLEAERLQIGRKVVVIVEGVYNGPTHKRIGHCLPGDVIYIAAGAYGEDLVASGMVAPWDESFSDADFDANEAALESYELPAFDPITGAPIPDTTAAEEVARRTAEMVESPARDPLTGAPIYPATTPGAVVSRASRTGRASTLAEPMATEPGAPGAPGAPGDFGYTERSEIGDQPFSGQQAMGYRDPATARAAVVADAIADPTADPNAPWRVFENSGLSESAAKNLYNAGIHSKAELATYYRERGMDALTRIKGIGPVKAAELLAWAGIAI